jgi:hypothetical protein
LIRESDKHCVPTREIAEMAGVPTDCAAAWLIDDTAASAPATTMFNLNAIITPPF